MPRRQTMRERYRPSPPRSRSTRHRHVRLTHPGDQVAAGQGLVVVEAMKMENELRAPKAGRVKEVAVEAGASVEAGRLLVVIE